jgi:hypothetical protein
MRAGRDGHGGIQLPDLRQVQQILRASERGVPAVPLRWAVSDN